MRLASFNTFQPQSRPLAHFSASALAPQFGKRQLSSSLSLKNFFRNRKPNKPGSATSQPDFDRRKVGTSLVLGGITTLLGGKYLLRDLLTPAASDLFQPSAPKSRPGIRPDASAPDWAVWESLTSGDHKARSAAYIEHLKRVKKPTPFDLALGLVLYDEGGFNPDDPSWYGITRDTLKNYCERKGQNNKFALQHSRKYGPNYPFSREKPLPYELIRSIYYDDYWIGSQANLFQLSPSILLMNTAVHEGLGGLGDIMDGLSISGAPRNRTFDMDRFNKRRIQYLRNLNSKYKDAFIDRAWLTLRVAKSLQKDSSLVANTNAKQTVSFASPQPKPTPPRFC